jgi:hypothetical protein
VPVSPVSRTALPVGADDLVEALRVADLFPEDDVFGLGALLEARDLGDARVQLPLGSRADDRAREDLAEKPEARDELRRPFALLDARREREEPDRLFPDTQGKHEVRRDAVLRHERALFRPGFR